MTEENNNNYVVYVHTTPTGMQYFGMSKNPKRRWMPSNYRNGTPFKDAIERYGWENIKHEILYSNLTRDEALKLEDELIVNGWSNGTCINKFRSGHYQQTDAYKEECKARTREWHKRKKEQRNNNNDK